MARALTRWVTRITLLAVFCGCAWSDRKIGIHVRLTDTKNMRGGIERYQVAASILMALRHVNDRVVSVIPQETVATLEEGFRLQWDMRDTFFSPRVGIVNTMEWTGLEGSEDSLVDMIIGASRSAVSGPVALVAQVTDTLLLSYSSTSTALSDKLLYPNFARTVPPDSFNAYAMADILGSMGWKAFSVLFVNDLYGVGYSLDLASVAGTLGLTIATAQQFTSGDAQSIRRALVNVRNASARVVVCIAFSSDMHTVLKFSQEVGISGPGWIWVTSDAISEPARMLDSSEDLGPALVGQLLHGWLQVRPAAFLRSRGRGFHQAWASEPAATFNNSLLAGFSPSALQATPCPDFCGFSYDAVWAAALAISRCKAQDGQPVDKAELQAQLLALDFEASTGQVRFDEHGDRALGSATLQMSNWVVNKRGQLEVRHLGTWDAQDGLQRNLSQTLVWGSAGVGGWASIPQDGWSCAPGSVYSDATWQCERCPPGTAQQQLACVPCEPGTAAAGWGMTQCAACSSGDYANETGQAQCTVCPQNSHVPYGTAPTRREACHCLPGYVLDCQWPLWKLLALLAGLVGLVAAASWVVKRVWWSEEGTVEQRRVKAKMKELRGRLRLEQREGVLLSGEARSVRLRVVQCWRAPRMHTLNPKLLENAARLALFEDFDAEALDMLYIYAHILDSDEDAGEGALLEPQEPQQLLWPHAEEEQAQRTHTRALSELLLDVSRVLLDPRDPSDAPTTADGEGSGAVPEEVRARSAEERFEFFVSRIAQLRLWQDGDNFSRLKEIAQGYMDELRRRCDGLYQALRHEDGGLDLIHFPASRSPPPPSPLESSGSPVACDEIDLAFPPRVLPAEPAGASLVEADEVQKEGAGAGKPGEEEGKGGLAFGRITRQDAPMVQAIRLDEEDWREIEIQWEDNVGPSSRSSARSMEPNVLEAHGCWPDAAERGGLGAERSGFHEAEGGASGAGEEELGHRGGIRRGLELAPGGGGGGREEGSVGSSEGGRRGRALSPGRGRWRAGLLSMGSNPTSKHSSSFHGPFTANARGSTSKERKASTVKKRKMDLSSAVLERALRRVMQRQGVEREAALQSLVVEEEVYIAHLHQRAALLDSGFQKKIRVAVGLCLLQHPDNPSAPTPTQATAHPLPPLLEPPAERHSLGAERAGWVGRAGRVLLHWILLLPARASSSPSSGHRDLEDSVVDAAIGQLSHNVVPGKHSAPSLISSSLRASSAPNGSFRAPSAQHSHSHHSQCPPSPQDAGPRSPGGSTHPEAGAREPARTGSAGGGDVHREGLQSAFLRERQRARSPGRCGRRSPGRLGADGSAGNARRGKWKLESELDGGGEGGAVRETQAAAAELALAACQHVQVHSAPIKTRARMRDKVKSYQEEREHGDEEYGLPLTGYILDPIRASVVCEGPRSILKHVEWFMGSWAGAELPVMRIKNKFAAENSAQYDGYRDLMLSVLYTGRQGLRIIGEVQFHDRRMHDLKVKMHKLYKVKRATSANQVL